MAGSMSTGQLDWCTFQAQQPLNPDLLDLSDAENAFFKTQTGIEDDAVLYEHIIAVQRKAFAIFPYPCIRRFGFAKLKISRLPPYEEVLALGRERRGAILLDLGCCFGNDARKAVLDGFPEAQVVASDIQAEFWTLGHELFRDSGRCGVRFVRGDVFSDQFIDLKTGANDSLPAEDPIASCVTTGSLNALRGRISAIHASAFFHLFNQEQQLDVARRCNALLSAEPGSILYGMHGGLPVAGSRPAVHGDAYMHSPESWKEMWTRAVPDGSITVDAQLLGLEFDGTKRESYSPDARILSGGWLVWTVRRV